jgi:hypothetical protein
LAVVRVQIQGEGTDPDGVRIGHAHTPTVVYLVSAVRIQGVAWFRILDIVLSATIRLNTIVHKLTASLIDISDLPSIKLRICSIIRRAFVNHLIKRIGCQVDGGATCRINRGGGGSRWGCWGVAGWMSYRVSSGSRADYELELLFCIFVTSRFGPQKERFSVCRNSLVQFKLIAAKATRKQDTTIWPGSIWGHRL